MPSEHAYDRWMSALNRRAPVLRLLLRPTTPPPAVGIVVGAAAIAVETVFVVLLKQVDPSQAFGTIYLLGVLAVSSVWGLGLSVAMSVISAFALAYFRDWPHGGFMPFGLQNAVVIAIFLMVALCTNFVTGLARARAVEADQRHREANALAEQQAGLRRVATLVARAASPSEVFSAVADEIAQCLNATNASINRFEGGEVVVLALSHLDAHMEHKPVVGERHTLEGDNIATRVLDTGRPARLDISELKSAPGSIAARLREMGLRCTIGAPIVVNGRVWGMAALASSAPEPLPSDTEVRIADFAELIATAIANADARAELHDSRDSLSVLATQQSALRRVATLVARGVGPAQVFSAVAEEMARCLNVDSAEVFRYEPDRTAVIVGSFANPGEPHIPVGERVTLEGDNVAAMVLHTGSTARIDNYANATGPLATRLREMGVRCRVGAPIVVDERVWGMAVVGWSRSHPLPSDTEERIAEFADLTATAIAAATTRADLIASRARIVAAADNARRRLERDLHDGAQQRLVSLGLQLRLAEAEIPPELTDPRRQLSDVVSGLADVSTDLREIARGIHPAILSKGGLGPALKTLARRCTVPVDLDLAIDRRFPDHVEVATYYVVAEALTNAAKHSQASVVRVSAQIDNDNLGLTIRDDGVGGADTGKGSGLIGLKDRVEALGGKIYLVSPPGGGTSLDITIPVTAD
jgi:signal transduction histidine kinase